MAVLDEFEKQWGGNVQQRMARRYNSFAAQFGASAPKPVPDDEALTEQVEQARKPDSAPANVQTDAAAPPPEPVSPPTQPAATPAQAPATSQAATQGQP